MSYIQTLLESENIQEFMKEEAELLKEAEMVVAEFPNILKEFVLENPKEFMAESLEETRKNIRTFSEVATAQFICEVTSIYGTPTDEDYEALKEDENLSPSIDDYL